MATKSYSKHKEYKEFKSSGNVPYTDQQFDMLKSELIPAKSKLDSLGRNNAGSREYHYEYKEEKHPSGKYDRKDLHTVEEFTIPPKTVPKSSESSSYYYEREERDLPALNNSRTYNYDSSYSTQSSSTPAYSKVKSSTLKKDTTHNVEELDSLLDDLQKDQDRQLYKSGYTSDTAESTSFDYRRGTPVKAPSSGYSTLKKEERLESSSWGSSPAPVRATELRQQMFREEKTESRIVPSQVSPALPQVVPAPVCVNCHPPSRTGTLTRSSPGMNKVTTTVKTYTYEVPADQDPTTVPLPVVPRHEHTYTTTKDHLTTATKTNLIPPSPSLGCQYCSHCNSRMPPSHTTTTQYHLSSDVTDRTNERIVYPTAANETRIVASDTHNGHGPYGPSSYKYSETTYSAHNTTERYPPSSPSPAPALRTPSPAPGVQQPPKKLDDLMANFPEARFPTQPDGVVQRKVEVLKESHSRDTRDTKPVSRNVAGPAVYYPPGHTPFQKKESAGYQASAMQSGGAYASGRGMYEYESGSKSKEKHSEKKTAIPVCLPLCCAMPCVIM